MHVKLKTPYVVSVLITVLMVVQSVLGLLFQRAYRDVEWIKATWFGNDWVTLVVGVSLMIAALVRVRQGSVPGLLLWLGMLGYSIYNYAFYLFGVALNAFFPLYVVVLVLSVTALILVLSHIDTSQVAARFTPRTPVRLIGGYLVFVAVAFASVWLGLWAAYAFAGRPTPVEPEAFKLVAALDLTMMLPALGLGGILLWQRKSWGYVIAAIAAIQGALYLFVLSVNAAVAMLVGLMEAPGELPIWGTLCVPTLIAAVLLLANARGSESTLVGAAPGRLHGTGGKPTQIARGVGQSPLPVTVLAQISLINGREARAVDRAVEHNELLPEEQGFGEQL